MNEREEGDLTIEEQAKLDLEYEDVLEQAEQRAYNDTI